ASRAGASGCRLKPSRPPEVSRAVRQDGAGGPLTTQPLLRKMLSYAAGHGPDPRRARAREQLYRLSDGERAVAALVGRGRTNGEIARELSLSVATVKAYVSRLLTKLDLNNRVQIALLVHDAALDD